MDYWTLSRLGREYYRVEIDTNPPISNWEVSFDHGATWTAMDHDVDTGYNSVLVCGPDFVVPEGDFATYVEISTSVMPYVRAINQPEVIIRSTPRIDLV
jgi:hypothetical protein